MKPGVRFLLTVVGLAAILVLTLVVFGLPVGPSLFRIEQGAFGDKFAIARTLVKSIPLCLTGLGVLVAWRAGMFNIGGEGQFLMGGALGGFLARALLGTSTPPLVFQILVLAGCVVGGAFWAWLAAWLFVKRGVAVVISTILLNFVAFNLLSYFVSGPLQQSSHQLPLSDQLPDALMLAKFDRQSDLHSGILVVLLAVAAIYVFLFLTKAGFRLRLVGENPSAARANRISAPTVQVRAMLVSGGLCGLAGGVEYLGISGQLGTGFSQNWGFLAIPVALLAGLHPLTLLLSALYFGALFAGTQNLAGFTQGGTDLIYVIQAFAVLGFVGLHSLADGRMVRKEAAS